MTPRRSFHFIVPVGSVLLTLVLVEVALAVFYPVPYALETSMYFEADPYTGYRNKPNGIGRYGNIVANANSQGHRDSEVSLRKPNSVFRILLLGDSYTVGASSEQAEAYPAVLEDLLNLRRPGAIEVVNAGVDGFEPYQYAEYYEHYGTAFNPDLVLVGFFVGNDTYGGPSALDQLQTAVMGRRVRRESAQGSLIELKVLLYENSQIARMYMNPGLVVRGRGNGTGYKCDNFRPTILEIQRRRMSNHLKRTPGRDAQARINIEQLVRIRDLAATNGSATVVTLLPDENQINPVMQQALLAEDELANYDFEMPQLMLQEAFRSEDIPVIDLLSAFIEDSRCLYRGETHWNSLGHALAAERISNGLFEFGLL